MNKTLMKSILEKQPYKVKGAYTEVLPIGEIKPDPLNSEIYPDDIATDKEHIEVIRSSIIKIGNLDCIMLYKDENYIHSGHHRFSAITGIKGITHVPISRSDMTYKEVLENEAEHIEGITVRNLRTPVNKYTAYKIVNRWISSKKAKDGKRPTMKDINAQGSNVGLGYRSWKDICNVEHGYTNAKGEKVKARPELLQDLKKGSSVRDIKSKQENDHRALQKKITNPKIKKHLNIFTREMALDLANLASEGMKFLDMNIPFRNNKDYKPFKDSDAAFKSTAVHNLITKAIPTLLHDEYGIIVTAPDKNNPMDIMSEPQEKTYNKPYTLETKTSKHKYFSSGNEKIGNHILVHFSNNYTEWFIATTYIDKDIWIPEWRGTSYKLWPKDIVTQDPNVLLGQIVDNNLITEKIN